jgi:murein DD-endopeptidase MepM/ murein hydrolase activator NlpD
MAGRTTKRGVTLSIVVLLSIITTSAILLPTRAHAGIFSFISNLLTTPFLSAIADGGSTDTHNSQNTLVLKAALNVDPNPSKGGGDITIVGGTALLSETGPSGSIADIEDRPLSSGQISVYVVREGDSLSQIADMFGVSVNTIIWSNNIQRGSIIREGQTLVILPISGVQYTVVKGDTLASITKKFKGDIHEIIQYNGLPENPTLAVGDTIVIPDGEMATVSYGSAVTTTVHGTGGPTYSGYYLMPVSGGGRKSQGLHGYNGVDLAASSGTPIVASATGDVIIAFNSGWNGGYGNYVVIRHDNGTQTLYAHLASNIVYVGQHVVQGQVIGYLGNTGRSTGPHLHFEVRGAKNPYN